MEFGNKQIIQNTPSLWSPLKRLVHNAKLALSACNLCGNACQTHTLLCDYCLLDLPEFSYRPINGDLLNWPAVNKIITAQSFDHLHSLSPHTWPFNQWISSLKYNGKFEIAGLLGWLLHDSWQSHMSLLSTSLAHNIEESTVILSVPLYITKWQERGYNQAHLIAKSFAKYTPIKYKSDVINRIINTETQVGKTGKERRSNMKGAFSINTEALALPAHVILIDDVVTTGSTVNEISALLKNYGVKKITVLSITISLPDQK